MTFSKWYVLLSDNIILDHKFGIKQNLRSNKISGQTKVGVNFRGSSLVGPKFLRVNIFGDQDFWKLKQLGDKYFGCQISLGGQLFWGVHIFVGTTLLGLKNLLEVYIFCGFKCLQVIISLGHNIWGCTNLKGANILFVKHVWGLTFWRVNIFGCQNSFVEVQTDLL